MMSVTATKEQGWVKLAVAVLAVLMLFAAPHAKAAASAGQAIVNTAQVAFQIAGAAGSVPSNTTTTQVAEILDLTLVRRTTGLVAVPSDFGAFGVPFVLTNTGNGNEAFHVEAAAQEGAPAVAIDTDGNGAYDPAIDAVLPADGTTPVLAPGASLDLLLRFTSQPGRASTATISAKALTGSGVPGTTFAGSGDQGSDAVVGSTHAEASLDFAFQPGTPDGAQATLEKSQTVRAPDGGTAPVPGAVITYRLALATSGTATMSDAEIIDPIPAGTAFVPGSIRIEDVASSDVADADAAFFDGSAIHIALGEISQPTTRVVTFQVTIL
jgi:uncharacterized repeat protein (TIGR01451 family)